MNSSNDSHVLQEPARQASKYCNYALHQRQVYKWMQYCVGNMQELHIGKYCNYALHHRQVYE